MKDLRNSTPTKNGPATRRDETKKGIDTLSGSPYEREWEHVMTRNDSGPDLTPGNHTAGETANEQRGVKRMSWLRGRDWDYIANMFLVGMAVLFVGAFIAFMVRTWDVAERLEASQKNFLAEMDDRHAAERKVSDAKFARERAVSDANWARERAASEAKLARERAASEAKLARERAVSEAKLARERAVSDAKLARERAVSDAKLARERAVSDANLATERARSDMRFNNFMQRLNTTQQENQRLLNLLFEYKEATDGNRLRIDRLEEAEGKDS